MLYPPVGELMKGVESRYGLVVITAKRARQIMDRAPVLTEHASSNPVTTAVNEIYEGKISIEEAEDKNER